MTSEERVEAIKKLKKLEGEFDYETVQDLGEFLDPELYSLQKASQGKVRFVYVAGKKAGYTQEEIEDFGHRYMSNLEIDKLITRLKDEAGMA